MKAETKGKSKKISEIQRILDEYEPGTMVKVELGTYLRLSRISLLMACLQGEGIEKSTKYGKAIFRMLSGEREWLESAMKQAEENEKGR